MLACWAGFAEGACGFDVGDVFVVFGEHEVGLAFAGGVCSPVVGGDVCAGGGGWGVVGGGGVCSVCIV